MAVIERLNSLLERLASYSLWAVAVELAVIWLVVFALVRFVQGTRAAGALKGLLLIAAVGVVLLSLGEGGRLFGRLSYLADRLLALAAVAMVVVFQPELRRGLIRLGEGPSFRAKGSERQRVIAAACDACGYLSKQRFGALIVFERQLGLRGLIEGGTELDARVSARLLQTIFTPGSALHDLAVVVRGERLAAAGVQLPLAEPEDMPDPELGSRHRAAVGVTKETDAVVLVVSEEKGTVRIAQRGRLSRAYAGDDLARELAERLGVRGGVDDEPEDGGRSAAATGRAVDEADADVEAEPLEPVMRTRGGLAETRGGLGEAGAEGRAADRKVGA